MLANYPLNFISNLIDLTLSRILVSHYHIYITNVYIPPTIVNLDDFMDFIDDLGGFLLNQCVLIGDLNLPAFYVFTYIRGTDEEDPASVSTSLRFWACVSPIPLIIITADYWI